MELQEGRSLQEGALITERGVERGIRELLTEFERPFKPPEGICVEELPEGGSPVNSLGPSSLDAFGCAEKGGSCSHLLFPPTSIFFSHPRLPLLSPTLPRDQLILRSITLLINST